MPASPSHWFGRSRSPPCRTPRRPISSMNAPRNLIGVGWFKTAATLNPVSYMIECVRSLIIVGWDPEALLLGFGFIVLIGIVSLALASRALRLRMTRT